MKVNITGAYHSVFGKRENDNLYSLYQEALEGVLKETGYKPEDIDGIFVANFSGGGFNQQENIASYAVNVSPTFRFKPIFRTETACSSGSSAVHLAMMSIMSGMMKRVIVVGLEKMTAASTADVSRILSYATYWPEEGGKDITAPCMFAKLARGWLMKYGMKEDELRKLLAQISAKAYSFASENPVSQIKKPRSADEILALPNEKNPIIEAPLRLHDCSLISDGSAAIILEADGAQKDEAIEIAGFCHASDFLDLFGINKADHFLEGAGFAVNKALSMAGMDITDIKQAEVHDCFTITELLLYSAMGLTKPGNEMEALENKIVTSGGSCVINSSGGLKAKGHPIGATGVAMHAHLYKQMIGEPYGIDIPGVDVSMVVNIGGSGTSNGVTILKKK